MADDNRRDRQDTDKDQDRDRIERQEHAERRATEQDLEDESDEFITDAEMEVREANSSPQKRRD